MIVESATLGASLFLVVAYVVRSGYCPLQKIIFVSLVVPFLLFALYHHTSTVTCDETYIAFEPVDILNSDMHQWSLGALRTTDLAVGLPMAVVSTLTGFTKDLLVVFAKQLQWMYGVVILLVCAHLLLQQTGLRKSHLTEVLFVFCSAVIFPVVVLGLKVFNYDSLSMLLGVVAVLIFLKGLAGDRKSLFIGIVTFALASQEKLIASPLLLMAVVVAGIRAASEKKDCKTSVVTGFKYSALASIVASGVFAVSFAIIMLVRWGRMPSYDPVGIMMPLWRALWPFLRGVNFLNPGDSGAPTELLGLFPMVIAGAILFGSLGAGGTLLFRFFNRSGILKLFIRKNISKISGITVFSCAVIGILSSLCIKGFLYPYFPVQAGGVIPTHMFNASAVHFNAQSGSGHMFSYIGWAYAHFFVAVPTVWLLAAVFTAFRRIFGLKRNDDDPCFLYRQSLLVMIFLIPALYGLFQVPVSARYLNLYLLLFLLITVTDILKQTLEMRNFHRKLLLGLILCAAFIEIFPFKPLGAAFRPLWLSYSQHYMQQPSKGILNPWWMGWGEEVAIAGRKIQSRYRKENGNFSRVRLYTNYLGNWLRRKPNIPIIQMDTASSFTYGEHDYYLLNRMGVAQSEYPFPESAMPYMKVEFRGFVQAWVFRGSDIPGFFDRKKSQREDR